MQHLYTMEILKVFARFYNGLRMSDVSFVWSLQNTSINYVFSSLDTLEHRKRTQVTGLGRLAAQFHQKMSLSRSLSSDLFNLGRSCEHFIECIHIMKKQSQTKWDTRLSDVRQPLTTDPRWTHNHQAYYNHSQIHSQARTALTLSRALHTSTKFWDHLSELRSRI
jgi:hypothetical protein